MKDDIFEKAHQDMLLNIPEGYSEKQVKIVVPDLLIKIAEMTIGKFGGGDSEKVLSMLISGMVRQRYESYYSEILPQIQKVKDPDLVNNLLNPPEDALKKINDQVKGIQEIMNSFKGLTSQMGGIADIQKQMETLNAGKISGGSK